MARWNCGKNSGHGRREERIKAVLWWRSYLRTGIGIHKDVPENGGHKDHMDRDVHRVVMVGTVKGELYRRVELSVFRQVGF